MLDMEGEEADMFSKLKQRLERRKEKNKMLMKVKNERLGKRVSLEKEEEKGMGLQLLFGSK